VVSRVKRVSTRFINRIEIPAGQDLGCARCSSIASILALVGARGALSHRERDSPCSCIDSASQASCSEAQRGRKRQPKHGEPPGGELT
jgi:hypothetical protein